MIKEAHPMSDYSQHPFSVEVTQKYMRRLIADQSMSLWVATKSNEVVGVIGAVRNEVFCSKSKHITALFVLVSKEGTGYGVALIRTFLGWAKAQKGVMGIDMGITSGMGDTSRTEKLFEKLGLEKTGSTWSLPGDWRYRKRGEKAWAA